MNDMTNETTPLYEALIAEVGNPIPAVPVDRSYEAILAEAEGIRSASAPHLDNTVVSLPAPAGPVAEETPSLAGASTQAG